MMAQLLILACLAASPSTCARFASDEVDVMQCTMLGEIAAAQWASEHPKWRVQGWACRIGKPPGHDT